MAGPGILHVDMDAFFASVEQRDDPSLRGKPVIVGASPGGRGVVCAASYEARVFGVRSAMPISEAYRRCPDGVYLPVRGSIYSEVSDQVMEILRRFSPIVETVSPDEAFLDVRGSERLLGDGPTIGRTIKQTIQQELDLVASVGVAPNKLVAKIASDHDKPDGLVVVRPDEVRGFLHDLPIRRLWGIGPVAASRLQQHGILTIGDIVRRGEEGMEEVLGGGRTAELVRRAHGEDGRAVKRRAAARSVGHETTFPEDRTDDAYLDATLLRLAEAVGRRLRRDGLTGATLTMKIRFRGFQTLTRRRKLTCPSALDEEIYEAAKTLLHDRVERRGRPVRLLGISMSDLSDRVARQLDLFGAAKGERRTRAAEAMDAIRERLGRRSIHRAGTLRPDERTNWRKRR